MTANTTVITLSILFGLVTFVIIYYRWKEIDITDIYIILIALFFYVYSIIDTTINSYPYYSALVCFIVFFKIFFVTILLWILTNLLFGKNRRYVSVKYYLFQWNKLSYASLILLSIAILSFVGYGFYKYGVLSQVSEDDMIRWNIVLPYWFTSARIFVNPINFCVFVGAFTKYVNAKGIMKLAMLSLIVISIVLAVLNGRRVITFFILFGLLISLYNANRSLISLRGIFSLVLGLLVLFAYSNIYQTYRANLGLSALYIKQDNSMDIYDSILNSQGTLKNLQKRQAMWRFNYMIEQNQIANDWEEVTYGDIIYQAIYNSIPRVFNPNKKVVDLDYLLASKYGFVKTDYPTNIFAVLQADIGEYSVPVAVLQFLLLVQLFIWLTKITIDKPFLYLLLSGNIIYYVVNVENSYSDYFLLIRNIVIIMCVYLLGYFVINIKPAILKKDTITIRRKTV